MNVVLNKLSAHLASRHSQKRMRHSPLRMLGILTAVLAMVFLFVAIKPKTAIGLSGAGNTNGRQEAATAFEPVASALPTPVPEAMVTPASPGISSVFSPEVKHWENQIVAWSAAYGVDPDMAATIMQIESCGDPMAISSAGALGLFQVMPFHFTPEEDGLDPDTNARRGLNYFADRLEQTGGDVGLAFAGYNGGHVAAAGSWDTWVDETRRYYVWATGIYRDAEAGLDQSPTLNEWMAAGGASLCRQAASRLGV